MRISLFDIDMAIKKYNLYLFIIFSCLFDDTSILDEQLKDENIITNSISIELLNCDSHLLISLINETSNYDKLLDRIKETLDDIKISSEDLERKKKVLISNELFSFENIEIINDMIVDNVIFEDKVDSNMIELIKGLNIDELNSIVNNIDLSNNSIVIVKDN